MFNLVEIVDAYHKFMHAVGDPSWFSKFLCAAFLFLYQKIRVLQKKMQLRLQWIDEQMPKNDEEKRAIDSRNKFIDSIMKKDLIERRDFEEFKQINMLEHQNIKDSLFQQLIDIKEQIKTVISLIK